MKRYNIGDICFTWDFDEYQFNPSMYIDSFIINNPEGLEEVLFSGQVQELEPYTKEEPINRNYVYELYKIGQERIMIYHWAKCRFGFAIWPDRIDCNSNNVCYFDPKVIDDHKMSFDWFFGLIGVHKILLQKRAPILHASYIDYNGEAILFTAPSQTGKSTQAKLWSNYAGAEIINGDRVLLRKKSGKWQAYGYPSCGSSDICLNRTLPVKAIVVLKQGDINKVDIISLSDKIRNIVAGIEMYRWDLSEVEQSLELAHEIASDVLVLQLTCTPDSDAVNVLRDYLEAYDEERF